MEQPVLPGEPADAAPTSARPGDAPEPPARGPNYAFDDHPRFAPDDDEPHITELERLYPDGMWPGHHDRARDDDRSMSPGDPSHSRVARARSALTLHEYSNAAAPRTGQVPPGATITILGEVEDWVLIAHKRPGGVTVGWTRRSGISAP
jgi:hypothetical protein